MQDLTIDGIEFEKMTTLSKMWISSEKAVYENRDIETLEIHFKRVDMFFQKAKKDFIKTYGEKLFNTLFSDAKS